MKKMKISISELRNLIQKILFEGPVGASVSSDPTDVKGFYPYDVERGVDVHGFWYKSPGRPQGSNGDPGRPEDAEEYIGFKTKDTTPTDALARSKPPSEGSE